MLSVAPVSSAGAAASYFTNDNYYTANDAATASSWQGRGAATLGLSGVVDETSFRAVLQGRLPDGSVLLGRADKEHQPGTDLTFSAPKSVSLMALVGGDARLAALWRDSVRAAMTWAERNLAETRMELDGRYQTVRTGNLVVGLFEHDTNRLQEPQLHVHAVVANATQGPDGKWRALDNRSLWKANTVLSSIANAHFRAKVGELGYGTELSGKHGSFELTDGAGAPLFDRETIMAFSTRRQEILAAMQQVDHHHPRVQDAVTVKTRAAKGTVEDRPALYAAWADKAREKGLDLPAMAAAAVGRSDSRDGPWDRVVAGLAGIVARGRALAQHIGALVKAPERDAFIPDDLARKPPDAIAAAHAVASALRHLSAREAAFRADDVLKSALDLGLPVSVDAIEARISALRQAGVLIGGTSDHPAMMTTAMALTIERKIIDEVETGKAAVAPLLSRAAAGERLQTAAAAVAGMKLNPGQEGAGIAVLASADRILAINGVAGAGKSSLLTPLAAVLREEGRRVFALGPQNKLVRELEASTGIASQTVAKFVYDHRQLLAADAEADKLAAARAVYGHSILFVDESSMVGNDQKLALVSLANLLGIAHLVPIGDTKQLLAVDAGKPFEVMQRSGMATSAMPENLRARTPEMKALAGAAQAGDIRRAIGILGARLVEAPDRMAETAAEMWLALPVKERDRTILMASGRANKALINQIVQQQRAERGELGSAVLRLDVLEQVNATGEELRYVASYREGQVIEFNRAQQALGLPRGQHQIVRADQHSGRLTLRGPDGKDRAFRPQRLGAQRKEDSLRLFERKSLSLRPGDQIRWGDTDKLRGLDNKAIARVIAVDGTGVTVENASGVQLTLAPNDPMLGKIDLAYALNIHMLQGATADKGIAVMDSAEKYLANERLFLVSVTRVRDEITVIADRADSLTRKLVGNRGDKGSALEVTGGLAPPGSPSLAGVDLELIDRQPDGLPSLTGAAWMPTGAFAEMARIGAAGAESLAGDSGARPGVGSGGRPMAPPINGGGDKPGATVPASKSDGPAATPPTMKEGEGPMPEPDLDISGGRPRQMDLDI